MYEIQCPTCFECFEVALDERSEQGETVLDYDCEICCRPMLVIIDEYGARAQSLDDL